MDTLSHAAWGYVILRWRGPKAARLGAVTGAAPDLLYFVPSKLQQVWENGWQALSPVRDPRIWRADGPPLPTDLIEAYHSYYVFTHSLVILTLVFGIFAVWGRRRWLWLALPYGAAHWHGSAHPRALSHADFLSFLGLEILGSELGRSPNILA